MAGGPDSTRSLSNFPARVGTMIFSLGIFNACPRRGMGGCSPAAISTGVQLIRSSEVAAQIFWSPQYIQYLPATRVAMIRPFSYRLTIDPDFDQSAAYFP